MPLESPQRLHPMTLVQRLLTSLPALLFLLLPFLRSPDKNAWFALFTAVAYGLIAIPWIVVHYQRFRYWITPQELVIQSGVFTRKHRNIPIERIQNIEVEQPLLPRLLGTARVKVQTAGSSATEGILEYVSVKEARHIRQVVRTYQQQLEDEPVAAHTPATEATVDRGAVAVPVAEPDDLFAMPFGHVLLSGVFRFSLLYIALAFSALQYFEPDPEVLFDWFTRGRLEPLTAQVADSPWLASLLGLVTAALFAWLTGILVNLNKYYGFRLRLEGNKLYSRHGLLTISEGTIPLKKIQTLIFRTNPLMARFGWQTLEVQTMGFDIQKQGYRVAAPFVQETTAQSIAAKLHPFQVPERFLPVSRLTIRRAVVRYSAGLLVLVLPASYFWPTALWGLLALPFLWMLAVLRYRHLGYAFDGHHLFVKRGFLRRYKWVIPLEKFQVLYASASFFQRRLGLKSIYVDTAGAGALAYPEIIDLPQNEADALLVTLYAQFSAKFEGERALDR